MLLKVAGRTGLKLCGRVGPSARIGEARFDVLRDSNAREEPDLDERRGPFRGVDTAVLRIETPSEAVKLVRLNPTTIVAFARFADRGTVGGSM